MKCDNIFCIYCDCEHGNICSLQAISLDKMGMCTQCIYINIDEATLRQEKNRLLSRYP